MQVTLVVKVGEVPVTFVMNNVAEKEHQTLLQMVYENYQLAEEEVYTFVYDGGLSEVTFKPLAVEAISATRSKP